MLEHKFSVAHQSLIRELESKGLRVEFSDVGSDPDKKYGCTIMLEDGSDSSATYGETPEIALLRTYKNVKLQWEA